MPPSKRQKHTEDVSDEDIAAQGTSPQEAEMEEYSAASGSEQPDGSEDEEGSTDTEDEIAGAKHTKSKKTLKRKRRATDATRFGSTLQYLLSTDAPSALPLSLKPSIARKRNDKKLEEKGKKVIQVERKEKEERGRVKDVIGGWGGESERALRKVAQRGVVKLFNVIQQSQVQVVAATEGLKKQRGSGKPTLPAPSLATDKQKRKQKPNILGQAKTSLVGEDDFLNSIRSGGIVSKV